MLNKLRLWILFAFIITSVICVSQSCQNDNIYFNVEDESEDFFLNRGERKEMELVDIRVEIKLVILCAKA